RALNHAVLDRGNAQGPELPRFTGFGDELAFRRAGPICAGAQFSPKSIEKALLSLLPDASYGHPVDASSAAALIGRHAMPSAAQHARVCQPAPHVPPLIAGICLTPLI